MGGKFKKVPRGKGMVKKGAAGGKNGPSKKPVTIKQKQKLAARKAAFKEKKAAELEAAAAAVVLSPSEVSAAKLFAVHADVDYEISFEEFQALMANLQQDRGEEEMGQEELLDLLEEVGAPEGVVTEVEFRMLLDLLFKDFEEKAFIEAMNRLVRACEELVAAPLFDAEQLMVVNRLYNLIDADRSGEIDREEFTNLLLAKFPEFDPEDIDESITDIGVAEGKPLQRTNFYRWMHDSFGDLPRGQFLRECEDLTQALKLIIEDQEEIMLPEHRKAKAELLFKTYDTDGSGFIEFPEFMTLMRALCSDVSEEDARANLVAVGAGEDGLSQIRFYAWVQDVFGEEDERDYEDSMTTLLGFASKQRSESGCATGVPQEVTYPEEPGWCENQLVCRENVQIDSGVPSVAPPEALGKDFKYWINSELPAGLEFDSETGRITGVPVVGTHGTKNYKVSAKNGLGSAVLEFALVVKRQGERQKRVETVTAKMRRERTGFGNVRSSEQTVAKNIRRKGPAIDASELCGDAGTQESVEAMLDKLEAERASLQKGMTHITVMKNRDRRAAKATEEPGMANTPEYTAVMDMGDIADLSGLSEMEFLHVIQSESHSRPVVVWDAKQLNIGEVQELGHLTMHLFQTMDPISFAPFTCVLDLTGMEDHNVVPSEWFDEVKGMLPERYKTNAMQCAVLGASTMGAKMKLGVVRTVFSSPLWDNFSYVDSFSELCELFQVQAEFWPDTVDPERLAAIQEAEAARLQEEEEKRRVAEAVAASLAGPPEEPEEESFLGTNMLGKNLLGGLTSSFSFRAEDETGEPEEEQATSSLFGSISIPTFAGTEESGTAEEAEGETGAEPEEEQAASSLFGSISMPTFAGTETAEEAEGNTGAEREEEQAASSLFGSISMPSFAGTEGSGTAEEAEGETEAEPEEEQAASSLFGSISMPSFDMPGIGVPSVPMPSMNLGGLGLFGENTQSKIKRLNKEVQQQRVQQEKQTGVLDPDAVAAFDELVDDTMISLMETLIGALSDASSKENEHVQPEQLKEIIAFLENKFEEITHQRKPEGSQDPAQLLELRAAQSRLSINAAKQARSILAVQELWAEDKVSLGMDQDAWRAMISFVELLMKQVRTPRELNEEAQLQASLETSPEEPAEESAVPEEPAVNDSSAVASAGEAAQGAAGDAKATLEQQCAQLEGALQLQMDTQAWEDATASCAKLEGLMQKFAELQDYAKAAALQKILSETQAILQEKLEAKPEAAVDDQDKVAQDEPIAAVVQEETSEESQLQNQTDLIVDNEPTFGKSGESVAEIEIDPKPKAPPAVEADPSPAVVDPYSGWR